jgi:Tfp pilus assembly ATPase PilU
MAPQSDNPVPPRQPLALPPNFRDVTAEKGSTVVVIVGATAAGKAKPK